MTYECTAKIKWIIDLFDDSVCSFAPNEIVRIELELRVMRLQLGSYKNAPSLFSFLEETIPNICVRTFACVQYLLEAKPIPID